MITYSADAGNILLVRRPAILSGGSCQYDIVGWFGEVNNSRERGRPGGMAAR
jgi:hypothetical protein